MGPRPPDFDEAVIMQSPTFVRWTKLEDGQKLRYACREFAKGHGDDEERLMRRIMIARRNNLRDHEILKKARKKKFSEMGADESGKQQAEDNGAKKQNEEEFAPTPKKRRSNQSYTMTDDEILREMDIPSVERTRSYKSWIELEDGKELTYNQKYIKGKEGHDWLLKKNIWRRMRYRRENKKLVNTLKTDCPEGVKFRNARLITEDEEVAVKPKIEALESAAATATQIVDHALQTAATKSGTLPDAIAGTNLNDAPKVEDESSATPALAPPPLPGSREETLVHDAVVEAAVAAAASYVQKARQSDEVDATASKETSVPDVTSTEKKAATMGVGDVATASVVAAAAQSAVHNPIISTDSMQEAVTGTIALDGDTLDVAAKLAAAASALSASEGNGETKEVTQEVSESTAL